MFRPRRLLLLRHRLLPRHLPGRPLRHDRGHRAPVVEAIEVTEAIEEGVRREMTEAEAHQAVAPEDLVAARGSASFSASARCAAFAWTKWISLTTRRPKCSTNLSRTAAKSCHAV